MKPCPFCGLKSHLKIIFQRSALKVHCNNCGADGPEDYSDVEVINRWNKRVEEKENGKK